MTVSEDINIASEASQSEQRQQANYFGFQERKKFYLPDRISFIEYEKMNEGAKKKFQDKTSRDMIVERTSGNARMTVLQGSERHELIVTCVKDWNLLGPDSTPILFNERIFRQWLDVADPEIVEDLEKEIRKANPWLLAEMEPEDIEKEIENLQEMLEIARKRKAGEAS